jgi:putative PIG3 family NAD(P)H quinone oxidoreductase
MIPVRDGDVTVNTPPSTTAVTATQAVTVSTDGRRDTSASCRPIRCRDPPPHPATADEVAEDGPMRAIVITEPGGPDVLRWTEVPDPVAAPGEVLIDVVACAVNRADLLQREGKYPPPPGASPYPGLECSGYVAALGDGVGGDDIRGDGGTGWAVGDAVCALLAGGGYAEKVAVPASQVLPVPPGVPVSDAAALPEVACTVWSNLVDVAQLKAGEVVLVHGGGSGIGTFAIQFATALGARVVTTARAPKHEALRALGAAVTIDYANEDFVEVVGPGTVNVILDIVGGPYLARNLAALAPDGRLVVISLQGGRTAELDLGALLTKRASVTATTLRARPTEQKAAIVAGVRRDVWPLLQGGGQHGEPAIRPVIDRRMSISEAAQAHRVVASSEHVGKILLTR